MKDVQIAMVSHRRQQPKRVVLTVDAAFERELAHWQSLATLWSTDMPIPVLG
jgi:hypothetical protein